MYRYINSLKLHEVGTTIIIIFIEQKIEAWVVKWLSQGHIAKKWQSLAPESMFIKHATPVAALKLLNSELSLPSRIVEKVKCMQDTVPDTH